MHISASNCGIIFWQKSSETEIKCNKVNVWNKILDYFSSFFKQFGDVCVYNIFTL